MTHISSSYTFNSLVHLAHKQFLKLFNRPYYGTITLSFLLFMLGHTVVNAQVSGKVFREFNLNGVGDAAITNSFRDRANGNATTLTTRLAEAGLSGATITVYGDNEVVLGTTTSSSTGDWSVAIPGSYTGSQVLVECNPPASLAFLQPGPHGTDNRTTVVRVAKNATNVNFTFGLGSEHAQNSPDLALACFALPGPSNATGNPGSGEAMVIRFPYINGGPLTNATRQATTGTGQNYYSATEYPPVTSKTVLTTFGQTGTVYGVAYDKRRNRLLTSAYERAYTGIGPNGTGGTGKIYVTTFNTNGTAAATSLWLDLETILSAGVAGVDPAITTGLTFVSGTPTTISRFEHNKIGHISLGDLEFSADGKTVFVVNLFSKQIYGIPVNADGSPDTDAIRTYTPTNPCASGSFTDPATPAGVRPYNVLLGLGVHPETGRIYCAVTCSGPAAADLKGYIYSFDPTAATTTFTEELQIPLNINFQTGDDGTEGSYATTGNDVWNPTDNDRDVTNTYSDHAWLGDIVFDIQPDGTTYMVVGGRNRFMDATSGSRITHGQGLWLSAPSGNSWTLESNGVAGSRTTANVLTEAWFAARNGNGVFFNTHGSEGTNGTGNIVALPGFSELALGAVDNVKSAGNSGIMFLDRNNGSRTRDILLLGSLASGGTPPRGEVYKANLWGEVEALLDPAPLEIGNYVFVDVNKNGLQDPSDLPIAGVTVKLVEDTNGDGMPNETAVASTTTDAGGQYFFDQTDGLKYDTKYVIVINQATDFTTGALGGLLATTANVGGNTKDTRDSDGELLGVDQYVKTAFETGGPGESRHNYDFGFIQPPCTPPVLAASVSQTLCGSGTFSPMSASVTSGTATTQQWYLTNAAKSSFTSIAGATNLTLTPTTSMTPTAGQTRYFALIAQNAFSYCADTAYVSLTLKPTQTISITTPSAATVTQCASGTMALSVSTNAVVPDNISLVYFASPQSGTAMYTGGTSLGTITSTTVAGTKTLSFTATLPSNPTSTTATIYVYALLASADGTCKPSDVVVVNIRPDFATALAGIPYICKGSSATLVALAAEGSTLRWSTGQSGVDLVSINPVISATATSPIEYSVTVVDANGCLSTPASYTVTPVVCTSCASSTTTIGGNVFQDYNADGTKDITDRNLAGITVTLFQCDPSGTSTQVTTITTDLNGAYSFTGLTAGTTYRVEFSNFPTGYTPTYRGTNNGSTVQFVRPGTCNASLGLNLSYDYCQTDPGFAVVCFTRNTDGTTEPTIIDMKYSTGLNFSPSSTADNSDDWGKPVGATSYPIATHSTVATKGDVGTTFGLAWDREHQQLLSGALMRGYAPMQTNTSTNGFGEATIYKINYGSGAAGTKSVWLDLEALYGDGFAGSFVADANYPSTRSFGTTNGTPAKIGYTGLGSLQFARDNHELYAVNLQTLEVLVIPIASDGSAIPTQIKRFPFPTDGCPAGTWSDGRPYRAALGLGVHPVTNRVYATLTCTGPTKADLKGIVYSFDPSDASPSASDFRRELDIPLNIKIPATNANSAPYYGQIVHAWDVLTANSAATTGYVDNFDNNSQHTQPWLGEIEFDRQADGTYGLVVGTRNRFADVINSSSYVAGGLLFRVTNGGTDATPDWQLEQHGTAGTFVSTVNYTFSSGRAGFNTDPGNRFFKYVGNEGTMLSGTSDYIPGRTEIIIPAQDNVYNSATSGMTWLNRITGDRSRDNRLLGNFTSAGYDATNFTKANNWGGLVVMCAQEPIQIGNRVWRDDNQNGIQDPCEPAIPGAVVTLYDATKTTAIASVTTNAAGEYYFSSLTLTAGTSTSAVATTALQYNTTYGLVITSLGTSTVVTSQGLSLTDVSPLTPGESGTLNSGLTTINNDAKLDAGKPCIKLTTGGPGDSNHTYDFGIVKATCSLTVTAQASSQTSCVGVPVTLTAQVSPASSYTYVWSAPAGVTLTSANTATATATASVAGLQTFTVTVTSSPTCFTTATVSVSVVNCAPKIAIAVTDPGTCLSATNGYTITGILSLTNAITGTATLTDGAVSTSVAVNAGDIAVPYSLSGLTSGTGTHTVTVSYASQTASTTYSAPVSCTVAPCGLSMIVTPGLCQSATNTYVLSTSVTAINVPISGTLTLSSSAFPDQIQELPAGNASGTFSYSGLVANGQVYTITASYSNTACSPVSQTFTAPISCSVAPVCSLSATATAGLCTTATNTYSATVVVDLVNAPAGTLTVSLPGSAPASQTLTAKTGLVTIVFQDLISDGASHTATVTLPGCGTTTATFMAPISCSVTPICSVSAIATPGLCQSATNTFTSVIVVTVTNPTVGVLTITDGPASQTFATTAVNVASFTATFANVSSDGANHTVTASLPGCSTTATSYTAPVSCSVAPVCSLSATATAGLCASATNTYSATVVISLVNAPAGTLTVNLPGSTPVSQTLAANAGSVTLVLPGLLSDGASRTATISLSDCGSTTAIFTAPASCSVTPVCSISAVATAGLCATATNTYSATAVVTVTNPAAGGTVTVTTGGQTLTFSTTALSQNTFTATFGGLISDGANHTVTVSLSDCGSVSTTYTAPASCSSAPVCSVSATATPGLCTTATNTFSTTVLVTLMNPTAGTLTVTDGVRSVTFVVPATLGTVTAPAVFNGIISDGSTHTVTVSLPGCSSTTLTYTAPVSCTTAPPLASLGDYVWQDTNKNGLQDVGEPGIPGVLATLYVNGAASLTTTTNGSGLYSFTGLTPGSSMSYAVGFSTPSGYTATLQNQGVDDAIDSDADVLTGKTQSVTLTPGEFNQTLDAGFYQPLGSIGDFVWYDVNKNGQQDAGESGVNGITVRLLKETTPGNYTVVSTTVTTGSGAYLFPNLPAGTYVVEFVTSTLPVNYVLTTANAVGIPTGLDSEANTATGRSGLVTLVPVNPAQRDILTIDAGIVSTDCVTSTCVPLIITKIRK